MAELTLIASLVLFPALWPPVQSDQIVQAERLFAGRDDIGNLGRAVSLLEDLGARQPKNYEILWRLSKYRYYSSDRETDSARKKKLLESGVDAGKKALEVDASRPEGHFWLGANYGDLAELKGAFSSLSLIKVIRKEFEAALNADPTYENGASYLALGEMYLSLPTLLGGSDRRGLELLEKGLQAAPTNAELKLTLAETYAKKGRKDEARRLLDSVIRDPDPARTPRELQEIREKARALLEHAAK